MPAAAGWFQRYFQHAIKVTIGNSVLLTLPCRVPRTLIDCFLVLNFRTPKSPRRPLRGTAELHHQYGICRRGYRAFLQRGKIFAPRQNSRSRDYVDVNYRLFAISNFFNDFKIMSALQYIWVIDQTRGQDGWILVKSIEDLLYGKRTPFSCGTLRVIPNGKDSAILHNFSSALF